MGFIWACGVTAGRRERAETTCTDTSGFKGVLMYVLGAPRYIGQPAKYLMDERPGTRQVKRASTSQGETVYKRQAEVVSRSVKDGRREEPVARHENYPQLALCLYRSVDSGSRSQQKAWRDVVEKVTRATVGGAIRQMSLL